MTDVVLQIVTSIFLRVSQYIKFLLLPQSYIPLHLACIGGHTSVVGLLLSKSAKQVRHH